jgi:hypothetical protein
MYKHLFDDGSGTMKVCRGKVHEYIGMTLDFSKPGKLKVMMLPYINEIVSDYTKYSKDLKLESPQQQITCSKLTITP